MRDTPMRWIEQAERRQVVTLALFERTPREPWSMTEWLARIGDWLAERHPIGPVAQLQPVLVRRPLRRRARPERW